jgi:hypothetical protein
VLLGTKLALLTLAWCVATSALGPNVRQRLVEVLPSPSGYLLVLPFAAATFWILSREERLGLRERSYAQGAVGLAVAFLSVLAPTVVYGLYMEGLLFGGNPLQLLGGACVLIVAMLLWRSRRRWDWRRTIALCSAAALLASCLPLLAYLDLVGPVVARTREVVQRQLWASSDQFLSGRFLIGSLIAALTAFMVVLTRPALRQPALFVLAVVLWGVPTFVLPRLGWPLEINPIAFDVVLSVCIALFLLAWWRGWQASVRPAELALLLVVTSAVIYAPVLKGFLDPVWWEVFLPFAFIAPAVTQLTLDVAPLNANGTGRERRIFATIGAMCLAFGLVIITLMARGPAYSLSLFTYLVDLGSGLSTIPFAVLLVAITSTALQEKKEAKAAAPERAHSISDGAA